MKARPILLALAVLAASAAVAGVVRAEEVRAPDAARGYRHMLDTAYVPSALDEEVLANLWRAWPEADPVPCFSWTTIHSKTSWTHSSFPS